MNRFAHLKATAEETPDASVLPAEQLINVTPKTPGASNKAIQALEPVSATPTPSSTELEEVVYLVERRIGIVGKIPASLKDNYDEMVLRSRKYIGRPNADLAVQAWVELTLEDENFRHNWLKRIQELKK